MLTILVTSSSNIVLKTSFSVVVANRRTGGVESFNTTQSYLEIALEPRQEYQVAVSVVRDGVSSRPLSDTLNLGTIWKMRCS